MYTVLDTNILLLDANNLLNIGKDTIVVLPETVLDEIDNKKSGHSEVAFQAREFGRLLTKASKVSTEVDGSLIITRLLLDNIHIEVVSLSQYPDYSDTEPNIINDRKIIDVAVAYHTTSRRPVIFMSNDVMCRIRADSMGLQTTDLKHVELNNIQFTKHVQVDSDQFQKLHNKPILEVDPDYKPENYNYVFIDSYTGQTKLANIRNNLVDILGKDTEQELAKQDATPMNSGQRFLSRAIQNPLTDVVVCEALAGSGFK